LVILWRKRILTRIIPYRNSDLSPLECRAARVLIVAHVDHNENIRIISARKTTPRERKYYEEEN
jgi:hypothetical protein